MPCVGSPDEYMSGAGKHVLTGDRRLQGERRATAAQTIDVSSARKNGASTAIEGSSIGDGPEAPVAILEGRKINCGTGGHAIQCQDAAHAGTAGVVGRREQGGQIRRVKQGCHGDTQNYGSGGTTAEITHPAAGDVRSRS